MFLVRVLTVSLCELLEEMRTNSRIAVRIHPIISIIPPFFLFEAVVETVDCVELDLDADFVGSVEGVDLLVELLEPDLWLV